MESSENKLIVKVFFYIFIISLIVPLFKTVIVDFVIDLMWKILIYKISNIPIKFIMEFITLFISYLLSISFFNDAFKSCRAYCGSVYMESLQFKNKFKKYFDFLSKSCKISEWLVDNKNISSFISISISFIMIFFVYRTFSLGRL